MGQRVTQEMRVRLLVDDLFSAVQEPQGFFHISDGESFDTAAELFERAASAFASVTANPDCAQSGV